MRTDIIYSWITILILGLFAGVIGLVRQAAEPVVICKQYHFDKVVYLTQDRQDSLSMSFDYTVPHYSIANENAPYQQLARTVCAAVLGDAFVDMKPQQALEAYAALKHTEYIQNNLPLMQEWEMDNPDQPHGATMFNQELIINASPLSTGHGIWSYGIDIYEYTGGAHGNNYLIIRNYDLSTEGLVTEEDLFRPDYFEPLHKLLVAALINQTEEASTERELKKLGYSIEDIVPNDNFSVSEEGITYVYNPYEIAPYAMGRTHIFLPWDTIQNLLSY